MPDLSLPALDTITPEKAEALLQAWVFFNGLPDFNTLQYIAEVAGLDFEVTRYWFYCRLNMQGIQYALAKATDTGTVIFPRLEEYYRLDEFSMVMHKERVLDRERGQDQETTRQGQPPRQPSQQRRRQQATEQHPPRPQRADRLHRSTTLGKASRRVMSETFSAATDQAHASSSSSLSSEEEHEKEKDKHRLSRSIIARRGLKPHQAAAESTPPDLTPSVSTTMATPAATHSASRSVKVVREGGSGVSQTDVSDTLGSSPIGGSKASPRGQPGSTSVDLGSSLPNMMEDQSVGNTFPDEDVVNRKEKGRPQERVRQAGGVEDVLRIWTLSQSHKTNLGTLTIDGGATVIDRVAVAPEVMDDDMVMDAGQAPPQTITAVCSKSGSLTPSPAALEVVAKVASRGSSHDCVPSKRHSRSKAATESISHQPSNVVAEGSDIDDSSEDKGGQVEHANIGSETWRPSLPGQLGSSTHRRSRHTDLVEKHGQKQQAVMSMSRRSKSRSSKTESESEQDEVVLLGTASVSVRPQASFERYPLSAGQWSRGTIGQSPRAASVLSIGQRDVATRKNDGISVSADKAGVSGAGDPVAGEEFRKKFQAEQRSRSRARSQARSRSRARPLSGGQWTPRDTEEELNSVSNNDGKSSDETNDGNKRPAVEESLDERIIAAIGNTSWREEFSSLKPKWRVKSVKPLNADAPSTFSTAPDTGAVNSPRLLISQDAVLDDTAMADEVLSPILSPILSPQTEHQDPLLTSSSTTVPLVTAPLETTPRISQINFPNFKRPTGGMGQSSSAAFDAERTESRRRDAERRQKEAEENEEEERLQKAYYSRDRSRHRVASPRQSPPPERGRSRARTSSTRYRAPAEDFDSDWERGKEDSRRMPGQDKDDPGNIERIHERQSRSSGTRGDTLNRSRGRAYRNRASSGYPWSHIKEDTDMLSGHVSHPKRSRSRVYSLTDRGGLQLESSYMTDAVCANEDVYDGVRTPMSLFRRRSDVANPGSKRYYVGRGIDMGDYRYDDYHGDYRYDDYHDSEGYSSDDYLNYGYGHEKYYYDEDRQDRTSKYYGRSRRDSRRSHRETMDVLEEGTDEGSPRERSSRSDWNHTVGSTRSRHRSSGDGERSPRDRDRNRERSHEQYRNKERDRGLSSRKQYSTGSKDYHREPKERSRSRPRSNDRSSDGRESRRRLSSADEGLEQELKKTTSRSYRRGRSRTHSRSESPKSHGREGQSRPSPQTSYRRGRSPRRRQGQPRSSSRSSEHISEGTHTSSKRIRLSSPPLVPELEHSGKFETEQGCEPQSGLELELVSASQSQLLPESQQPQALPSEPQLPPPHLAVPDREMIPLPSATSRTASRVTSVSSSSSRSTIIVTSQIVRTVPAATVTSASVDIVAQIPEATGSVSAAQEVKVGSVDAPIRESKEATSTSTVKEPAIKLQTQTQIQTQEVKKTKKIKIVREFNMEDFQDAERLMSAIPQTQSQPSSQPSSQPQTLSPPLLLQAQSEQSSPQGQRDPQQSEGEVGEEEETVITFKGVHAANLKMQRQQQSDQKKQQRRLQQRRQQQ
ncbi:hypothetical protein EDD11_009753 [Mortierella claussenii]|nr:hypothetical protein EDD11_009753 [Mortierella claussenii]